jgi:gas vesicle protein
MENSTEVTKIVGSMLVGAAIGGILGILFAPHKGSKTRGKLMAKGEEIKDLITDQFTEVMDQIGTNTHQNLADKIK